jgi:hypothetical protein
MDTAASAMADAGAIQLVFARVNGTESRSGGGGAGNASSPPVRRDQRKVWTRQVLTQAGTVWTACGRERPVLVACYFHNMAAVTVAEALTRLAD